ncbi:MAG: T9SS type A sorting domain-containing protein [Candidatus Kerfeldbacteria bacterium]|nr:T9SS type A sorting domain-containing protein [Candidatus Kerfeldbacteria bacterium]
MKRCLLLCLVLLAATRQSGAQVIQAWQETGAASQPLSPEAVQVPNTSLGEEFGSQVFIVRNGSGFTTSYMFKDRNEGNPIYLEDLAFYGRREDGVWVRYFHLPYPSCTERVSNDMRFYHLGFGLGPDFDGYPVGARIGFRWTTRFRNVFCSTPVDKNQEFQLIKGEPLPSYPNQYPSSVHNHSGNTDNLGESGGSKTNIDQFWIVGGRIYWWTDHAYDFTSAECQQMGVDADTFTVRSQGKLLALGGVEGNIDDDNDNDFPDGFLHTLTNVCLRTPWEFPGDNSSSRLWTLAQFQDSIAARGGLWAAAHPFSSFPIPGVNAQLGIWQPSHIALAMPDPNFLGWQIWNRPRSSTRVVVSDLNHINPYPWVNDPEANRALEFGLNQVDAIQQAYLEPLRRATMLAGTDDHWDRAYTLTYNASGQIEVHNSALGKCFTVAEMPSFTAAAYWEALRQGRLYLSNGPACRFGVDLDNDGDLETTYGQNHLNPTGSIRLFAQSNSEFGSFTRAILYIITPSSRDSMIVPLSGMSVNTGWPVSVTSGAPAAVRARLETAGGYGDEPGLVLTGWLYFNTDPVSVNQATPTKLWLSPPLPNPGSSVVSWTIAMAQDDEVHLTVTDLAGRIVATVYNGYLPAGTRTFRWDGHRTPPGMYLLTLRTNTESQSRKLLLLR